MPPGRSIAISETDKSQLACLAAGPLALLAVIGIARLTDLEDDFALLSALLLSVLFLVVAPASVVWTAWSVASARNGRSLLPPKLILIALNVIALLLAPRILAPGYDIAFAVIAGVAALVIAFCFRASQKFGE
jgi:hypothetical protein